MLGRGGIDKASDCNNGFFVRHDDEWDWLRSFLTIDKLIELLGPEEYKGKPIDRFEMPHLNAVQFLLLRPSRPRLQYFLYLRHTGQNLYGIPE